VAQRIIQCLAGLRQIRDGGQPVKREGKAGVELGGTLKRVMRRRRSPAPELAFALR